MARTSVQTPQNPSIQQLESYLAADMFSRMTESCRKKCVKPDHKEGELNKGEHLCLDRCVFKYFLMHESRLQGYLMKFLAK